MGGGHARLGDQLGQARGGALAPGQEGVDVVELLLGSTDLPTRAGELSAAVLDRLWSGGVLQSTLLLSPPGGGKTTLLRDLIRAVSDGEGGPALRVGVADERGELAAMYQGEPQFSIGRQTDVLDGCPKGPALLMLLRGMNPQVLAADEITAPEDAAALEMAANCGVSLLCTAHAGSLEELKARPLYRRLLDEGLFRRLAIIERAGRERRYQVVELC